MAFAFLSEGWCARANELFGAALPIQRGSNARVQYVIGAPEALCGGEVIRDGGIEWSTGRLRAADVEVHWTMADAVGILARRVNGNDATARTRVVTTRRPGVTYRGFPPPMDLASQQELAFMPIVRDADLRVVWELRAAPFGDTYCTFSFVGGQLGALSLGVAEDADVALTVPFRTLMGFYRGELSALDALQHGTIGGCQGALALLCGLVESPPYRHALAACAAGPAPLALATLGEVTAHDAYRDAMRSLLAETVLPLAGEQRA